MSKYMMLLGAISFLQTGFFEDLHEVMEKLTRLN